jgi:hypothetical protein
MRQLLLLSFLTISFCSFSQIPAGSRLLGGNLGFSLSKSDYPNNETSNVSFYVSPRFGKAVKDNVVKGIGFVYQVQQYEATGQALSTTHQIGLELFKQQYLPIGNSFMVFGEGNIGANYGWLKKTTRSGSISAGLGAGLAYRAKQKLMFTLSFPNAVSAFVGYNQIEYNNGAMPTSTAKVYNAGFRSTVSLNNLQFGIQLLR